MVESRSLSLQRGLLRFGKKVAPALKALSQHNRQQLTVTSAETGLITCRKSKKSRGAQFTINQTSIYFAHHLLPLFHFLLYLFVVIPWSVLGNIVASFFWSNTLQFRALIFWFAEWSCVSIEAENSNNTCAKWELHTNIEEKKKPK